MAIEITLNDNRKELERIRIPYNGRDAFSVLNETLSLEGSDALTWADYASDTPERLDNKEVRKLHERLMNSLADVMLEPVWRYPNGSPLSTLDKATTQNEIVNILVLLREAQRDETKHVVVRA